MTDQSTLRSLNNELELQKSHCTRLELKISDLEKEIKYGESRDNRNQSEIYEMKERIQSLESQRQSLQREKNEIIDELIDSRKKLERRDHEISNLNEELKLLTDKLKVEINAKYAAVEKLQEVENLEIDLGSKEKRMETERKYYLEQIEHLTNELNKRSKEVLNARFELSSKLELTELRLDEKNEEIRVLRESNADEAKEMDNLRKEISDLNDQLDEERKNRAIIKESLERELESQTKLIELYKNSYEEEQNKTLELADAMDNLQARMKESSVEARKMEQELRDRIECLENEIVVKDDCIRVLKDEQTNSVSCQNKEEIARIAVENLTPHRAAAYKFLKTGTSMTEVYSKFIDLTDQIAGMQEENVRLKTGIDNLLQSVEEKELAIRKQIEVHEQGAIEMQKLHEEIDRLIIENCAMKSQMTEAKSSAGFFERENVRRKQEVADLSKQLCHMLNHQRNKIQTDGSGAAVHFDDDGRAGALGLTTANSVITQHLVTFRDIEELQENNRKLLSLVRELSAKQEEIEQMDMNDVAQLKQDYEKISNEYRTLLDNYETQAHILQMTIKQRDSIKNSSGFLQACDEHNISSTNTAAGTTVAAQSEAIDSLQTKLKETEQQLIAVREEYSKYQIERKEAERSSSQQIKDLKEDYQKIVEKSAKLSNSFEVLTKKLSTLQTALETSKKQVRALEEKNNVLNGTITKLEQTSQHLNNELLRSNENLASYEVVARDLEMRNRLLQENESKLIIEKENLVKNYENRNMMSTNLEMIKTAIERMELEGKIRLENQLEEVLRECSALRRRLQEEQDFCREQVAAAQQKLDTLKERYDQEVQLSKETAVNLEKAYGELKSKQETIDSLAKSQTHQDDKQLAAYKEQIKELENQVTETKLQVESLNKQQRDAKTHIEQLKSLAETSENLLREKENEMQKIREIAADEMMLKTNEIGALKAKIGELEAIVASVTAQMDIDSKTRTEYLEEQLDEYKVQLKANEAEVLRLQEALNAAEDNYTKEIVSRASDLEKNAIIKENLLKITNQLNDEKSKHNQTIEMLKLEKKLAVEREKLLEEERAKLLERGASLEKQNDILHGELETLNQQFAVLNSQLNLSMQSSDADDSFTAAAAAATAGGTANSSELLKVIKYLRKEKELAIANLNLSKETQSRLESQLKLQNDELANLKQLWNNKKNETETRQVMASKYEELQKKVEMLNALMDSNKTLRDERNDLKEKYDAVAEKCQRLEAGTEPLQKQLTETNEKVENLTAEIGLLRNDCNRWKSRANLLMEKNSKMCSEDLKKVQTERDALLKTLAAEKETIKRTGDELTALKNEKAKCDEKIAMLTKQASGQTEELVALKKEQTKNTEIVKQKTEEVETLNTELKKVRVREVQIKQLARKYRTECDKLKKEAEEGSKAAAAVATTSAVVGQQVAGGVLDAGEQQRFKEHEAELNTRIESLNGLITTKDEENQKLRNEIEELKMSGNERMKNCLSTAKSKIIQLTDQKESLSRELVEARNDISLKVELTNRLSSINESLESQIQQLEQDKSSVISEKERFMRDIDTLNQKYQQLLLMRQSGGSQLQTTCSGTNTDKLNESSLSTTTSSSSSSSASSALSALSASMTTTPISSVPPTANVKPITGGHSQSSSFNNWRANETPPLASIRPIAQTRLATVQPHQSQPPQPLLQQQQQQQVAVPANNSAIVVPHHQMVHTTDETAADLSSTTSSHTEYMPATSSAGSMIYQRQACVMPTVMGSCSAISQEDNTAVSTQDVEPTAAAATAAVAGTSQQHQQQLQVLVSPQVQAQPVLAAQQPQPQQQQLQVTAPLQPQVVALVMPRMEPNTMSTTGSSALITMSSATVSSVSSSGATTTSTTISCQQAASSSTGVTTSQAMVATKRSREPDLDDDNAGGGSGGSGSGGSGGSSGSSSSGASGSQNDSSSLSQQVKRSRMQLIDSQNNQNISESGIEEIEIEYQVPTSSQRDQDDDVVIDDSGDDEDDDDEEIAEELDEIDDNNADRELHYEELELEHSLSNQENNEVEVIYENSQNNMNESVDQQMIANESQNAEAMSREQSHQSETISSGSDETTAAAAAAYARNARNAQTIRPSYMPLLQQNTSAAAAAATASYDESMMDVSIVPGTPTHFAARRSETISGVDLTTPSTHFPFGNDTATVADTSNNFNTSSSGRTVPNTPSEQLILQSNSNELQTGGNESQTSQDVVLGAVEGGSSSSSVVVHEKSDPNSITLVDDDEDDGTGGDNNVDGTERGNENADDNEVDEGEVVDVDDDDDDVDGIEDPDDDENLETANLPEVDYESGVNDCDNSIDLTEEDREAEASIYTGAVASATTISGGSSSHSNVNVAGSSTSFIPTIGGSGMPHVYGSRGGALKKPIVWGSDSQPSGSRGGGSANTTPTIRGHYARGSRLRRPRRSPRF